MERMRRNKPGRGIFIWFVAVSALVFAAGGAEEARAHTNAYTIAFASTNTVVNPAHQLIYYFDTTANRVTYLNIAASDPAGYMTGTHATVDVQWDFYDDNCVFLGDAFRCMTQFDYDILDLSAGVRDMNCSNALSGTPVPTNGKRGFAVATPWDPVAPFYWHQQDHPVILIGSQTIAHTADGWAYGWNAWGRVAMTNQALLGSISSLDTDDTLYAMMGNLGSIDLTEYNFLFYNPNNLTNSEVIFLKLVTNFGQVPVDTGGYTSTLGGFLSNKDETVTAIPARSVGCVYRSSFLGYTGGINPNTEGYAATFIDSDNAVEDHLFLGIYAQQLGGHGAGDWMHAVFPGSLP